ncbi:MAG: DUF971 domain-containing protein [Pseudomonadota bacterium]
MSAEPLGEGGTEAWPTDLSLNKAEQVLTISFDDGAVFRLTAELLRVESPSADVQGHAPSQKTIVAGKRNVAITAIEPVGNYAVRLRFDDGHDTGIYTWRALHHMGQQQEDLWATYLAALSDRGLTRDR